MRKDFDLQLFAEDMFSIPGIDDDIAKELSGEFADKADEETEEDAEAVETSTEEAAETAAVTADADSDNKQVDAAENKAGDGEDDEHRGAIPYKRFAEVNQERNEYKKRIAELEAKLADKPVASPATQAKAGDDKAGVAAAHFAPDALTEEQMQKIVKIAVANAKDKLKLTDEDLESMNFADGVERKAQFDAVVQQEVGRIQNGIREYAQRQQTMRQQEDVFKQETEMVSRQFDEYNAKFAAYEDCEARWSYISEQKFSQLPPMQQRVVDDAFSRIKAHKGTYQDFYIVESYFNEANAEYEKTLASAASVQTDTKSKVEEVKNKITKAQALPKATEVAGDGAGDKLYTPEKIAQILNGPSDGWDKLPEEIKQKVLRGTL
jgi:hypothetical protein